MRAGTCVSADLSGEQHGQGSHHEQHTDHRECVAEPHDQRLAPDHVADRNNRLVLRRHRVRCPVCQEVGGQKGFAAEVSETVSSAWVGLSVVEPARPLYRAT